MKQLSEEIIKMIENYDVVTFDVFDTLVKRNTQSFRDVYKLMDRKYNDITGKRIPKWFYRERVHAPKVAYKRNGKQEANLNEIYDVLHVENKEIIKHLECEVELEYVTRNPVIYDVYQYCCASNKRIYAISDMYLPQEVVKKILGKCGYKFEKIFVSCEYRASKANGKLYSYFMDEMNIKPEQFVHIGDNYNSDVLSAQSKGIKAIKIDGDDFYLRYTKQKKAFCTVDERILNKFISNRLKDIDNPVEKIGYEILGPLLYYYTLWLEERISENRIIDAYFCARDGYLLKKAYEVLHTNKNKCKLHYFYVSKRSVSAAYNRLGNQRENLKIYMKQENMEEKAGLVDIGWSGRMHKMLNEICENKIYGFYFGTFSAFKKNVHDGISGGWLNISRYKMAKVYMNAGFIEILFSDTYSGTTSSYKREENVVFPVKTSQNPNGKIIRAMQDGALKFIKEWHDAAYTDIDVKSNSLINSLLNFCIYPFYEDVNLISDELYGVGEKYCKLVNVDMNINRLQGLKKACWKGGYLTKACRYNFIGRVYEIFNPIILMFKI